MRELKNQLHKDDVDDKAMTQDFVDSGAVYPKVDPEHIAKLMRNVTYVSERVGNTTTVVSSAVLTINGHTFVLAHESTACADPRNFNEEKGKFYAAQKAMKAAREKLWELEGYKLFCQIASE